MKSYLVEREGRFCLTFEVMAENEDEAVDIACERDYKLENFDFDFEYANAWEMNE